MDMMLPKFRDRVNGCMVGLTIGDALGLPVETSTRARILAATGGAGVTGFDNVPRLTTHETTKDLPTGAVSDDTILSMAVATSLVRCREFDVLDSTREQVAAYDRGIPGMGRATRVRLEQAKRWFASDGQEGEDPRAYPNNTSMGNGVAMKVAPLAIAHALDTGSRNLWGSVNQLGRLTHGDLRASLAAFSVAALLMDIIRAYPARVDFTHAFVSLRKIQATLVSIEDLWRQGKGDIAPGSRFGAEDPRPFYGRTKLLLDMAMAQEQDGPFQEKEPDALLERIGGANCVVMESVPMAIGIFLRHPQNFDRAVLEAVNCGGDTDSIASMVGALVGANVGLSEIPIDLVAGSHGSGQARELAYSLFETFRK